MTMLLSGQWFRDAHSIVSLVPRKYSEKSKLGTVSPRSAAALTACGEGAHGTVNTLEAKLNIPMRLHLLAWLARVVLAGLALRVFTVVLWRDTYTVSFRTGLLVWSTPIATPCVVARPTLEAARATARLLNQALMT